MKRLKNNFMELYQFTGEPREFNNGSRVFKLGGVFEVQISSAGDNIFTVTCIDDDGTLMKDVGYDEFKSTINIIINTLRVISRIADVTNKAVFSAFVEAFDFGGYMKTSRMDKEFDKVKERLDHIIEATLEADKNLHDARNEAIVVEDRKEKEQKKVTTSIGLGLARRRVKELEVQLDQETAAISKVVSEKNNVFYKMDRVAVENRLDSKRAIANMCRFSDRTFNKMFGKKIRAYVDGKVKQ